MSGVLVDSSIILDVFENDPVWADWSEAALDNYSTRMPLFITRLSTGKCRSAFSALRSWRRHLPGAGCECWRYPERHFFSRAKPI